MLFVMQNYFWNIVLDQVDFDIEFCQNVYKLIELDVKMRWLCVPLNNLIVGNPRVNELSTLVDPQGISCYRVQWTITLLESLNVYTDV
jgi:hypothetical protein